MRTLLTTLLLTASLAAHDPGLSSAALRLGNGAATLQLTFNGADLAVLTGCDRSGNGRLDANEVREGGAALLAWARAGVALHCGGALAATAPADDLATACANGDVQLSLHFTLPTAGADPMRLSMHLLTGLARGHRQYAAVFDPSGTLLAEALLRPDHTVLDIAATTDVSSAPSAWRKAGNFFALGVEHILTGYDHLMFLLGLLLVAGSLRQIGVLITSFTIAHSLTLGLATLDLVRPPGAIIEALIALSIVWVGVENLITRAPRRRWLATFGFGLVHGFGFATALQDLGIAGSGGLLLPLVSFNLGVESGQLAVAAVLLPPIWWCAQRPDIHRRLVPVLSLLVSAAGATWLVERTLL